MSDQVTAREVAELLGDLIENIGYPVGMGMRPDPGTLERLATRALAAAVAGEWRPIETAPKDGHFLVWMTVEMLGSRIQVMRAGKVALIGGYFAYDAEGEPTHWRPLPAPPAIRSPETAQAGDATEKENEHG